MLARKSGSSYCS